MEDGGSVVPWIPQEETTRTIYRKRTRLQEGIAA